VAIKNSPLIAQYLSVKQKVPDAILFFRLGDFYEMLFEDAEVGARVLDIQLTSRSKDGVPLCGVPYHSAEPYIAKLLKAGLKVAICEQTQAEPRPRATNAAAGQVARPDEPFQLTPPRGLMPRQIVRVITPGTVGEETVLAAGEKSFLLALGAGGASEGGFALAAVDVSTGEFLATRIAGVAGVREEIARIAPREIIAPRDDAALAALLEAVACPVTWLDSQGFAAGRPRAALAARFGAVAADALGEAIGSAADAALVYVEETFGRELAHLRAPHLYRAAEYMLVDEVSRRHLELVISSDATRQGSLLSVLDETLTPVGARALQNWIVYPLLDLDAICARHDAVEELFETDLGGEVAEALRRIGDLERLAGRIGSLRASPRDCLKLEQALRAVGALSAALQRCQSALIREVAARLVPMPELAARIDATIGDEPPVNPRDGNVIRSGLSPEVDELRALASDARGVIARLEATERARSNIPSLKVRYNQVFGYYIEVSKPNLDRVPSDYERKQTLVGAERFTTVALKELERKSSAPSRDSRNSNLGSSPSWCATLRCMPGQSSRRRPRWASSTRCWLWRRLRGGAGTSGRG
jgi:DNA mismatch repair protein MutS